MKYIIQAIFLLVLVNASYAQSFMIDSTGKKVPVPQKIVTSKPPESDEIPKAPHVADNNSVKVGLLYFISGVEPVYYERRIFPWLSIEAGAGLTTRDFVSDLVNLVLAGYGVNEGLNPYYTYNQRKSLVGGYASLQPKFFIRNNALAGFWFGPVLEFKRDNYKANLANVNAPPDDNGNPVYLTNSYQKEFRNALDFTFNVGWQFKYNHSLTLEYLMGAGFRRFWEQRSDVEAYSTPSGYAPYFSNGVRIYNGYRPEINMELNFGGFF